MRNKPGHAKNVAINAVPTVPGIRKFGPKIFTSSLLIHPIGTIRRVIPTGTLMTSLVLSSREYMLVTSAKPNLTHKQKREPHAQNVVMRSAPSVHGSNQEGSNQNRTLKYWKVCDFAWLRCRHRTADIVTKQNGSNTTQPL